MQNFTKLKKRIFTLFLSFLMAVSCIYVPVYAADNFEKSIKAFPESYKIYLRELHKEYPKWSFVPLETGLDWNEAVEAQYAKNRSLFTASTAYTDIYRSRETSDYNYDTNTYIQKDAGFVRANKLTVSYYMDPRNFLKPEGIFQFEKLSFDSSITVDDVETILKGSFMHNKKPSYKGGTVKKSVDEKTGETIYTYNISKKKKTGKEKYSELFYEAGKKYNINPCFLAAKTLNEVGLDGTNSVSGNQSKYPGIYNFYNVGAYDGKNPIETGLYWASSNGTYAPASYQRPWTSPKKSIMGGAEFNSEKYINAGQYTSYLQKFNVDPESKYETYTHQYMTNVVGAAYPAYQTYKTYLENGAIQNKYIFVIPIYENMPSHNTVSGSIYAADALNQIGKINTSCNVRKGPSVDSELSGIQLSSGHEVTILDAVLTNTRYTDNIMRYPYWYKIQFKYDGKSKTGYVYSNFVSLITQTLVGKGKYTPLTFSTSSEISYNYLSDNVNVAGIIDNKTVNFKKTGKTVNITAYDSTGNYSKIKYKVVKDADKYNINNIILTDTTHKSTVISFDKNENFNSYEILLADKSGNIVQHISTKKNKVTIKNLDFLTQYIIGVRGYKNTSSTKNYGRVCGLINFETKDTPERPEAVTGLNAACTDMQTVIITWNATNNADGYNLYTCDKNGDKKKLLADLSESETSYFDISENAVNTTYYTICAYKNINKKTLYSDFSEVIQYTPSAAELEKIQFISVESSTNNSIKLKWDGTSDAESYTIYAYNNETKKYDRIGYTNDTFFNAEKLKSSTEYKFIVKPAITLYDKLCEGAGISISSRTTPDKVKKIYLSNVTTTSYTLKWNSVKGANGYTVYIYDGKTKKYKKYKNTSKNYLKFSELSAGKKTDFKIKAYYKTEEKTFYSKLSSAFIATTKPSKTKNVKKSEIKSTSVKLTWDKAKGATGYRIYSYNSKKGTYKLLGETTGTNIVLTNLKPKKKYKFMVRSFSKTKNCRYFGTGSDKITVTTKK